MYTHSGRVLLAPKGDGDGTGMERSGVCELGTSYIALPTLVNLARGAWEEP